jgi:hypothetical protein
MAHMSRMQELLAHNAESRAQLGQISRQIMAQTQHMMTMMEHVQQTLAAGPQLAMQALAAIRDPEQMQMLMDSTGSMLEHQGAGHDVDGADGDGASD